MGKRSCITGILLITFAVIRAQSPELDSLLKLLPAATEDTNKVHLLHSIADHYEGSEPEQAKVYVRQAGNLSAKLDFKQGRLKFVKHLGFIYAYQYRYDSMLHYYKQGLDLAKELRDTFNIGICSFNMGQAYQYLTEYERGLDYSLKGLRLLEGKGYTQIESNLNGGIMATYIMLRQYDKAVEYGLRAVELGRNIENKQPLASALTNLANCYGELNKYKEARKLYYEAIRLAQQLGNVGIEAVGWQGLAILALHEGKYDTSKAYIDKALPMHARMQDRYGVMAGNNVLSYYHLQKKDFGSAKQYIWDALAISKAENYADAKAELLNTLAAVAFATHNFDSGIYYSFQSKRVSDNLFTESVAKKDASLRVLYETEKKESQIKLQQARLKQQNTLNYVLIGSASALLIITSLGYRTYKHKQKLQQQRISELETEKQLTAADAVLKGEEQERTRLAKDLHDGLGGMLSGLKYTLGNMKGNLIMTPENARAFERSMDMLDSSISEMRRVAHNMMPEALVKFGLDAALKDFCSEINQSGALKVSCQSIGMESVQLEQTVSITIYRVVQELINNVIKHASAMNAIVQVSYADGHISVTVEDDGKGFDTGVLAQSRGIGWSNIQSRVDYLKGKLDIRSSPGKGTSVLIELQTSQ